MINVTQTYIQHRHKLFGPCSGKKDLMHLFCTLYGASHHNNLIINNRRNHDDDCSFVKQKCDQPKAKGCDADQPERTGQRFADDLSPLLPEHGKHAFTSKIYFGILVRWRRVGTRLQTDLGGPWVPLVWLHDSKCSRH